MADEERMREHRYVFPADGRVVRVADQGAVRQIVEDPLRIARALQIEQIQADLERNIGNELDVNGSARLKVERCFFGFITKVIAMCIRPFIADQFGKSLSVCRQIAFRLPLQQPWSSSLWQQTEYAGARQSRWPLHSRSDYPQCPQ